MKTFGLLILSVIAVGASAGSPIASAQTAAPSAPGAAPPAQKHPPTPTPPRSQSARVLDLTTVPVVIRKSGRYVLNRSWTVAPADPFAIPNLLDVRADDVVIDFSGFELRYDIIGTAISVSGANVTLRGGTLLSLSDESRPIMSTGEHTVVERMSILAVLGVGLIGPRSVLRDSEMSHRFGPGLGEDSLVERNRISCSQTGLDVSARSRVVDNEVGGAIDLGTIRLVGDGTVVSGNVFRADPNGSQIVINIQGNNNVVRDNTITWSYPPSVVIAVAGSANVIDGNIGAITEPPGVPPRANVGIAFRADGNFYGDNRLEATVLIDAAGTMQTDWGGNVAF